MVEECCRKATARFASFESGICITADVFQYRKSTYKIPMMSQWLVIAPGFDKVEEIRRAPDDVLSAQDAVADVSAHIYCPWPSELTAYKDLAHRYNPWT